MTFKVTIQANLKAEERFWNGLPSQANRAASQALTALAKGSHADQRARIGQDIDRPNPYTRNSMVWYGARVGRLESGVFVKRNQSVYLSRLVTPQVKRRVPKSKYIFVPSRRERRDAFGNMSRARRRNVLSNPNLIVKQDGQSRHAFLRQGKRLVYVGSFVRQTVYTRRYWRFYHNAETYYAKNFSRLYAGIWNKIVGSYSRRSRR